MNFRVVFVIALLFTSSCYSADEPKKPSLVQPIPELKLTNGKVFKNVSVIRYGKETVTLKSSAGIGPIPYSYVPQPERGLMLAERDTPAARTQSVAARELTGQVFITTRGAGAYKFSGVSVAAYPKVAYEPALNRVKYIARSGDHNSFQQAWTKEITDMKPIATATTDADGKFSLSLPSNDSAVFLHCFATRATSRYIGDQLTSFTEIYVWAAPVADGAKSFDLNGTNYVSSP